MTAVTATLPPRPLQASAGERVVRVGCPAHNCGGRCLLVAHVADGRIVRLDTDDRPGDTPADPQLRACTRGRAYLKRQYHPDRLTHPLKRVGPRGAGRWERISWDEALDRFAGELQRVKATYGNGALFVPYGTGSYSQLNGSQVARRLMNLFGGCLGIWNSYSWGATNVATPTVYGTLETGSQRQDWPNAKYILMWGWNPAEMRDGTNSDWFIKLARERGARTVCIDPRMSLSAVSLADEWIPIRPGTDTAMMTAMAYVMITEGLHDADFVRTHCVGFDASQLPSGCEGDESYRDYVLGTRDGVPKTPEWAERITTVPRETIARIAQVGIACRQFAAAIQMLRSAANDVSGSRGDRQGAHGRRSLVNAPECRGQDCAEPGAVSAPHARPAAWAHRKVWSRWRPHLASIPYLPGGCESKKSKGEAS